MIYMRVWWRCVAMALMRDTAYRFSFVLRVGEGVLQVFVAAFTVVLIYQFTDSVAGWGRADVLLVLGIYRVVEGLVRCQFAPNLWNVPGMIRRGEMDAVLLRPVSSRFLVSTYTLDLPELANVLIGAGLVLYAGQAAGVAWNALEVGAALLFGACGLTLLYAVWLACVTLAFWLIDTGPLSQVLETLRGAGRYPVAFFPGPARLFFTAVFPVAFATTFPASALRGQIDWRLLLVGVSTAALSLLATGRFWQFALRHYSSASS